MIIIIFYTGDCRSALQLGRDLLIECARGDDPIISKLASSLLEVFDASHSTTPPLTVSPYLKFPRDNRQHVGNVHVNTFRY
jgi:hypothetical protein